MKQEDKELMVMESKMMNDEWKEAILKVYKMHQHIKPEFSCTLCKAKINPPTCNGCPIYCQTCSLD